ncbi:hypothetical protein D3C76_1499590 [compost metagenome]
MCQGHRGAVDLQTPLQYVPGRYGGGVNGAFAQDLEGQHAMTVVKKDDGEHFVLVTGQLQLQVALGHVWGIPATSNPAPSA